VTDPAVDAHRIAALGHSRNGKTALLAAAFDERIAMAFPHQAGCGGSAPSRSKTGESVKAINTRFPHWFNARFKEFNDAPERLPFDQECLVALCAPRPVLFSAAEGDQWSNPAGQFQVLQAAASVYQLFGVEGLTAKEMPPLRQLVGSRLGYYIREGKHSMTVDDWRAFMDFADKQWNRTGRKFETRNPKSEPSFLNRNRRDAKRRGHRWVSVVSNRSVEFVPEESREKDTSTLLE
jgi:hypothetical protein